VYGSSAGKDIAKERLYLAERVPMLIIWGERDRIIPVSEPEAEHSADVSACSGDRHRDDGSPAAFLEILIPSALKFERAGPRKDRPVRVGLASDGYDAAATSATNFGPRVPRPVRLV
jgi:hypothetical protein